MAEINDLNITDASNTARFPEGQAPSTVNDGARALEGLIARWHNDINGSKATTGSANAYVLAANQTLSAYYDGLMLAFDANFANTGAATLNVDSLGAKNILKNNDVALASGDIEAGQKVVVVYDGVSFQMLSPVATVYADPLTTRGDVVIRGASSTDRLAIGAANTVFQSDGTDPSWNTVATDMIADNAVTLAKMAGGTDGNLITYDAAGDPAFVATGTSGQVLTSNGAGAAPTFQASGVTAGTAAEDNPYAIDTTTTQAHGLGSEPDYVKLTLTCIDAGGDIGWAQNDVAFLNAYTTSDAAVNAMVSVEIDATNVSIITGSALPELINKSTLNNAAITASKWKITAKPFLFS